MRQRSGVVREVLDIKEDCPRNVLREIARAGINRWGNTHRRKRGIKNDDTWIVQTAG